MLNTISDVMTRDVVVVAPDATFREVVRLIEDRHVDALPVVDDAGTVIGMVSEGDLLLKEELADGTHHLSGTPWNRRRDRLRAGATTVQEVMTRRVVTVGPEATLSAAARLMHRHRVGGLPVVDGDRKLVGIVTRSDVLRVFLRGDDELRAELATLGPVISDGITCSVAEGRVSLQGRVYLHSEARRAAEAVRRIPGVIEVDDQVRYDVDDLVMTMAGA